MKNFLAVYTGSEEAMARSGWNELSEADRQKRTQAGLQAWYAWMEKNKDRVVVTGSPLGKTKRVSTDGVTDIRNQLAGYVVVAAETHDEAARLFEGHPHFSIFPGDAVEVMECLPVPGA